MTPGSFARWAAGGPPPPDLDEVQSWSPSHWQPSLRLLDRHRVTALAQDRLARERLRPPLDFAAALLQARVRNQMWHARRMTDLQALGARWAALGLPWLPLKGADLSRRVYPDPALRPSADLDVLVPAERIAEAEQAARDAGFAPPDGRPSDRSLRRYHFHSTFRHPGSGTFLELHWRLADRASLPGGETESAWFTAGHLPDDAHLVYLCAHLAKHGWMNPLLLGETDGADVLLHPVADVRLIWLTDLVRLREATGLDADRLRARARAWGVESALADAGRLLAFVLGDVAPGWANPGAPGGRMGWLERRIARRFLPRLRRELADGSADSAPLPWLLRPHPVWHVRPVRVLRGLG